MAGPGQSPYRKDLFKQESRAVVDAEVPWEIPEWGTVGLPR